jgi:hypothetical protein
MESVMDVLFVYKPGEFLTMVSVVDLFKPFGNTQMIRVYEVDKSISKICSRNFIMNLFILFFFRIMGRTFFNIDV